MNLKEYNHIQYLKYRNQKLQYQKDYYSIHKEKIIKRQTKYIKSFCINNPYTVSLNSAKARAKKKKLEFNLTIQWCKDNWTGKCALTGIYFYTLKPNKKQIFQWNSCTIDRIDSSKGYTQDNCRFILFCINAFKGTMSDKEMLNVAAKLLI